MQDKYQLPSWKTNAIRFISLLLLLGFLSGLGSLILNNRQDKRSQTDEPQSLAMAEPAALDQNPGPITEPEHIDATTNIPSIYPSFGRISDHYGNRIHPISGKREFHYGLDIANQPGTPVYATAAGVVAKVDYDSGYGKRVYIDHENGYCTLYAHLYNSQVRTGEKVGKGQIIALMGNTGLSTGPHLHYEVHYNNSKLNPASYLKRQAYYASK